MSTFYGAPGKKGDLEVTLIEARNVNCKGHSVYCLVQLKSTKNNTASKAIHSSSSKDTKWNQPITLDLMTLDDEELVVQLFYKRSTKKDKFLGQVQLSIHALSLSKEAEWYYLSDRPENERKKAKPDLKKSRSLSMLKGKAEAFVVTGEIYFKLNFIHRLLKAKSKLSVSSAHPPPAALAAVAAANSQHPPNSPQTPTKPAGYSSRLVASPSVSSRFLELQRNGDTSPNGKPPTTPEHSHGHEEEEELPPADFSSHEEVIIDEALKEKRKIVRDKLEQGEKIVRAMTAKIKEKELTEGEESVKEDRVKLDQVKKEINELSKLLALTQDEPHVDRGRTKTVSIASPRDSELPRHQPPSSPLPPLPFHSSGSNLLPSSPSPSPSPVSLPSATGVSITAPGLSRVPPMAMSGEKFDSPSEEIKFLRMRMALLEQNNNALCLYVARLERDVARFNKEEELKEREARLRQREEKLLFAEQKSPRRGLNASLQSLPVENMKLEESGEFHDQDGYDLESPRMMNALADAKYDMIVSKLEKLDKLDELLRKLDTMKMNGGGAVGEMMTSDGRGYAELKAELESIQTIIMDETGKYTEKQKEEANIRYEKVAQEFQKTPEYRQEVAAALEERRKKNEPLNKAALDRMVKVYTSEAIRENPELKDKVQKNPELTLIGMDPKMILAKHQNDFQQYMLRNLTLDELRAIRASLPKFRNDQKRQADWTDSLEEKIETVSKNPPKPPAPKKAAIKIKTKPPGSGVDFLSELKAKHGKGL